MRSFVTILTVAAAVLTLGVAGAEDKPAPADYATWPVLRSTFPSTSGGDLMIKGYDPVIIGDKCMTTFMAVEPGGKGPVYPNYIEFEAKSVQGGTLCTNGKWRSFDGKSNGTTAFQVFFKDSVFRGWPL